MKIYDGSADRPPVETTHTVFVISCGICRSSDTLTVRRRGREDWSLLYCEKGAVHFQDHLLLPGQIWIYPPKIPHWYLVQRSEGTEYRYLHFTGSDLPALMESLSIPLLRPVDGVSSGELMEAIQIAVKGDDAAGALEGEILTLRLLSRLSGRTASLGRNTAMCRVIDEMEHSLSEPYDGVRFARILGISVSRFNHLFAEYTGVPPKRYFLSLRMENACRLLEDTDFSVARIAALSGYADPACFGQIFKAYRGKSPTAYRTAVCGEDPLNVKK